MAVETCPAASPGGDALPGGDPTTAAAATTISALASPPCSGSRLPKKQLVSCEIQAHSIQRCPSPKKKALDPLRYMPERASYHAMFVVVARFEDESGEYPAMRSYKQFQSLHIQLQKKFPKSKLPKDLPSIRKKRFDDQYIEQKGVELSEYLKLLVELAEVKNSKILRDFLEESPQSEDSDDDSGAPSKMMDGLPGTIVRVRAGQSFSVSLRLLHAGDIASWQFTTKKHNIGFSATFNGATVHVYTREDAQLKPVKGSFACTEPGTLALDWDNTYTWSKTKVLIYWAEVEQAKAVACLNLDALGGGAEGLLSPQAADSNLMVDARRSGYIAQSRNASYPRQIMSTSLSLITKPFVRGRSGQNAQFHCGPLIVERNFKFRGRNWYRKWFVLDTRKCILRYYDSEQTSKKGLSLAKMNLATKNACLAITSNDEAAPTPYLFMVRARKRCWKMCASSQAEYNEWEHAISTAILTTQLKRRNDRNDGDIDRNNGDHLNDLDGVEESDDDEEDEDEDGGKDDDDDESADEEEIDSDPASLRGSGESGLFQLDTSPIHGRSDQDGDSFGDIGGSKEVDLALLQDAMKLAFCDHWIGKMRTLSTAKKLLVALWLNSFLYSLHTSASFFDLSTVVFVNAYLLVHTLERRRRRPPSTPTKDKFV